MNANTKDLIARGTAALMNTFPTQNFVLDHGKGCYLYDTEGREYLDFAAGIAVVALGHASPVLINALKEQAEKVTMSVASHLTEAKVEAAETLTKGRPCNKAFFTNSGTEAMEGALKLARAWAHENRGHDVKEFIAFRNSFHGRSYGANSITEKSLTYPQFGPYLPGCHFAQFNDLDSVKKLVNDKTCAIILEPVQGEGGITPASAEFIKGLRALCDEKNIILIFDEIQCGMGRIGHFFAYEHFGVEPDIITLAKGIGSGFPVGALLAREKFASAFSPGVHGTTYGGNPLACAVIRAVTREISKPELLAHVRETGAALVEGLKDIQRRSNKIEDVRGLGLMVGADLSVDIKAFLGKLRDNGMFATQAGGKTLRLTPPLIAGPKETGQALEIIEKTLKEF
ncbi:MAG: aspartate aminotransferase family protein [Alphaproteobacteria bacterium]|nr:aspartate aminotransferase family protein [Alphaproteobacteria bacterium]